MAKTPKPWFRKGRGWFVTIAGKQHNLGRGKKAAFQEYYRLMNQPAEHLQVSGRTMAAVIDDFLEYLSRNRAPDTYRWYRDLLQKFIVLHKELRVDDIRPFHVQRWVDSYSHLSKTSRRNHMRSVKRCIKWAVARRVEVPSFWQRDTRSVGRSRQTHSMPRHPKHPAIAISGWLVCREDS